jgi:nucleoside-diphosphate-sugar epimerase
VIAVTGAGGFIGTALGGALARSGRPVLELRRPGAPPPATGLSRVEIPGLDRAALARALRGAQAVVHLAGRAHRLREDDADPLTAFRRVNVEGTRAVMEAAADAGVARVLLASSVKAVGESNQAPWTETTPAAPTDPYGVSKLEAEHAALETGARLGVEAVVMRFPLVYGPGAPANVRRLVALVNRGWPLPFGAIVNRRSMLSMGNLVAAVESLLTTPGIGGEVFFVADGVDLSTPELVRTIAAGLERPARLIPVPPLLLRAMGVAGDGIARLVRFPITSAEIARLSESLTVSIAKLVSRCGFRPPETPADGWRKVAEWYRSAAG